MGWRDFFNDWTPWLEVSFRPNPSAWCLHAHSDDIDYWWAITVGPLQVTFSPGAAYKRRQP